MERKIFVLQLFDTFTTWFVHCEQTYDSSKHNMGNAAMFMSDLLWSHAKTCLHLTWKFRSKSQSKSHFWRAEWFSRPILPVKVTVTIDSDLFFYKIRSVVWSHFYSSVVVIDTICIKFINMHEGRDGNSYIRPKLSRFTIVIALTKRPPR